MVVVSKVFLVDVSITHPASPSFLRLHSQPFGAAVSREAAKTRKYAALAEMEGATFVPFVLESFGALASAARRFLGDVVALAADVAMVPASSPQLCRALSVVLQRGNALILRSGAQRVRHHLGSRH